MPLHEVGYRAWNGRRTSRDTRWWVLADTGIRLIWRSNWLKRAITFMWLPAIGVAIGFFIYEQSLLQPSYRRPIEAFLRSSGFASSIGVQFGEDPALARHGIWSLLLLAFFRYPQLLGIVLVVGLIAPRQISYDIRTRAFLLLFSRPVSPFQYVLGKQCIIWFYLSMVTAVPALLLYALAIMLSPDLSVVSQTWDLPARIVLASMFFIIPTSSVALSFAAIVQDSRFAGFAWYALWVMGWAAYSVLTIATMGVSPGRRMRGAPIEWPTRWEFVSPYHVLGRVEQWCFGLLPDDYSIWGYVTALVALTIVSWSIVQWRIRSVSKA